MPNLSTWSNLHKLFAISGRRSRASVLLAALALAIPVSARAQVAEITIGPDGLALEPLVAVDSLTVIASGPEGITVRRTLSGEGTAVFPIFDENGEVMPDGTYFYHVTGSPALHSDTRATLAACSEAADCNSLVAALRASGELPDEAEMKQSGSFTIEAGYAVPANETEGAGAVPQVINPNGNYFVGDGGFSEDFCVGCPNNFNPSTTIHVISGNDTAVLFDQDTSSGFPAGRWLVAASHAQFQISDLNGGFRTPFKILPGAPNESFLIDADGDVGVGATGSDLFATFEVRKFDGTAQILVDENSPTAASRFLFELENNGPPRMRFRNTDTGNEWWYGPEGVAGPSADRFVITRPGSGGGEFNIFRNGRIIMGRPSGGNKFDLSTSGDLTIAGTLTENSDAKAKRDIEPLDGASVLSQVAALPVSTWRYKADETGARHVGPMAQDFHAAFGLGTNDTTLAPRDVAGIALAAVKELQEIVREKDEELAAMRAQLAAFKEVEARLTALEERLSHDWPGGMR